MEFSFDFSASVLGFAERKKERERERAKERVKVEVRCGTWRKDLIVAACGIFTRFCRKRVGGGVGAGRNAV